MTAATLRADALACHAAALTAVEPARMVGNHIGRTPAGLVLRGADGRVMARHRGRIVVVGGGKAGLRMAHAVAAAAGPACAGGLIVVPHGAAGACPGGIEVTTGAHPVPDAGGEVATARLLAMVAAAGAEILVIAVMSGGASALLVAPVAGVSLADKQTVTARLLDAGADITALNTVRKHCSRVKGGGMARAAAGAAGLWALLLSDVVGDDPATIASGPAAADPTTFADASRVLACWTDAEAIPAGVRAHLARGEAGAVAETVKPGDPVLARVQTAVVGGNRDAVVAAAATAAARGYAADILATPLGGDAATAGHSLAARLLALPRERPVAVVAGGETTVRVAAGGRGGRCQHLALAAALDLAGVPCAFLAAGTDGVDGPTDAAGACVDGGTVARALARGLDPGRALATTDSHRLLHATGDTLPGGPTGTNVADLVVALRGPC